MSAILDSPEVAELIARIDGLKLRKRRGYGTRTLIGACLVRSIYALPTWTRTAELIGEHAALADAIGGTPSEWACYRFIAKLREHAVTLAECVDRIAGQLRCELPEYGRDTAIDASDMPAYRTVSGTSTTTARSGSGTPTRTLPGGTGALSAPGRAAASTGTSSTFALAA